MSVGNNLRKFTIFQTKPFGARQKHMHRMFNICRKFCGNISYGYEIVNQKGELLNVPSVIAGGKMIPSLKQTATLRLYVMRLT